MAPATGADDLVDALERLGVELVWGLPGVHNLPIWRRLAASDIRLVGVRHEQTAVYAADGYARSTGRLGVAVVTTGPGAANTLGATGEAMASGSPVLVIATDIAAALRRPGVYRGALHETRDQAAMFAPVTRAAATAGAADEIGGLVLGSGLRALMAPSGPVYVGIPTDFLSASLSAGTFGRASSGSQTGLPATRYLTDDEITYGDDAGLVSGLLVGGHLPGDIQVAVDRLQAARHPLIWAGGGAVHSGAGPALGDLACALAAPVITTYQSRGILPPEHPCAVAGSAHAPEIGALWDEADVVIAVGSDLDGINTQNWAMPAPPTLITVNVDPADAGKNYPADLSLAGDARPIVERLAALISPRGDVEALRARLATIAEAVAVSIAADEPEAARFLDVMERVISEDTVVVADMCIPGYWLGGYGRFRRPRRLAFPMGWGTLGFGFPASLGAALANTGPAVCVCGDGGFLFACGELATVAQERIPLTVVLVDDGGYGMLRYDQVAAGDEPFGVDLVRPDFAALAASFGVPAVTVDGFGDRFEAALVAGVSKGQPNVIVVRARLKPPLTTSPRWYRRRA